MKIAPSNAFSIAPIGPGWEVSFNFADGEDIVCPVIGWATVATARLDTDETTTSIEPAFVWLDHVWTETDMREHTPGALRFEIRTSEINPASGKPTPDDTEVRVFHRADGWTLSPSQTVEPCSSNYDRERAGVSDCPATAVWKVVELRDLGATIGFWCDSDLPAEHRHLALSASA